MTWVQNTERHGSKINMTIFNVDMDNTLIYSYKHDIGEHKKCAEIYQGREISFMTYRTQELLREVAEKILVVPTTTRTIEQYNRIDLGLEKIPYVLACNGGVLLVDGAEDEEWYAESIALIAESHEELQKGMAIMEQDENRCFEVRNIKGLFLFTKSNAPEMSVEMLSQKLDTALVDVFHNGIKVYVVPKKLSKGNAILRFKEKMKADRVIAAGDSEFDISMIQAADIGIAPKGLVMDEAEEEIIVRINETQLFSEGLLEYVAGCI